MAKTFDERVALAAGGAPTTEADKSEERSQGDNNSEESEESQDDAESEDESETEDDDADEDDESEDEDAGGDPDVDAAKKAFESGDLKAVAKALGLPESMADTTDRKFGVLRQKARDIKRAEKDSMRAVQKEEARVTKLYEQARAEYGNPIAAAKAYGAGEYHKAGEYLQKLFGDDFSTITMNMAKGHAGVTKEQQEAIRERKKLEEERAALQREKQESQKKLLQEQNRARAVANISRKLKGHAFVKDEEDASEVMRELEKTWDPEKRKFSKTPKQVADELLEKERARLRKRGLLPAAKPKPNNPSGKKPPTPPKTETVSKTEARKLSLSDRIARAERMTAQLNRL